MGTEQPHLSPVQVQDPLQIRSRCVSLGLCASEVHVPTQATKSDGAGSALDTKAHLQPLKGTMSKRNNQTRHARKEDRTRRSVEGAKQRIERRKAKRLKAKAKREEGNNEGSEG